MAFVNVSLLLGGLLMALPIVLHLVMRERPKQLVFPATRFLRARREANRRRLQLRHWVLLAMRCAAIGLLALALARPSVSSAVAGDWGILALLALLAAAVLALLVASLVQRRGKVLVAGLAVAACILVTATSLLAVRTLAGSPAVLPVDREAPVSAILVFDTSPRMQYRQRNATRLDAARDIGLWLITQFPADSQVAIVDSRSGPAFFAVDLAAARKAAERLQMTGTPDRLPAVLERALMLASTAKHPRREVYVFTDLAAASWRTESPDALARRWGRVPGISLYVIDVGVPHPANFSLGDIKLSAEILPKSSELVVETEARATGTGGRRAIELHLEEPDAERPLMVDGHPQLAVAHRRDRQELQLAENAAQRVVFRLRGLSPGVHQGQVRLAADDGLAVDDVRYFAVEVKEAWPVLVAAPRDAETSFLVQAIAPYEYQRTDRARFACTVIPQSALAQQALEAYAAVCLLDPEPLPPAGWEQLTRYVDRGGSLAVFLGHHAQPAAAFETEAARRLLGGSLARQWRAAGGGVFLAPRDYEHPVLAPFRQQATSVPWEASPVFRHWVMESLAPETQVLICYSNGKPAILEKPLGKGRILTMTTPISDSARPAGRAAWNQLPTGEEPWPYFVLVNEILRYLAGSRESRLNYLAGETAVLANDPDRDPQRYQLFTPLEEPQEITARDERVVVKFTERPGAYRLKGNRGGPVVRGFAVNLPAEASDMTRLPPERLADVLGKERYQVARSREEIVRQVGIARVGREFYPLLIAALALVLGLEHLLANRFYRRNEAAKGDEAAGDGGETRTGGAQHAA